MRLPCLHYKQNRNGVSITAWSFNIVGQILKNQPFIQSAERCGHFRKIIWRTDDKHQQPLPLLQLLLFPRQPHFNKVLHILVKVHWRRSNVNLFKSFLNQRIFVTADCIR